MKRAVLTAVVVFVLIMNSDDGICGELALVLGSEGLVQANSTDIYVPGYSVPSYPDWNNDGKKDLVVGEGSGSYTAKIRVYLNVGTELDPQFSTYFYAQSGGGDLTCVGSGCLGCFPRVVYWDGDGRKDLLVGQSDGTVKIFLNVGSDSNPIFDGGTLLQVGQPGTKTNIDVGSRATCTVVDWNSDGRKDLVVGAYDGRIHLFINEGSDDAPDFLSETFAQEDSLDLYVPSSRSSPAVLDLDNDGKKDLLTGNTNGQLVFYSNVGTEEVPSFSGYLAVESNGVAIDLPSIPRSRPFVCDWTGDNYPDVLIGAGDGKVHLYQGLPFPGDFEPDGDVDFYDFAVFAPAWKSSGGGGNWNPDCDISNPNDGVIDELDLAVFAENWLASAK